ncbi:hypothetical protein HK100_010364, partial [Physocladia obscura]
MRGTSTPISGTFTPNDNTNDSVFPINSTLLATANNLYAWDNDNLAHSIDLINSWVNTATPSPFEATVILFHCGHGQDRTGAIAGAYNMKFIGQTYDEVWATNKAIGMDVPANVNQMR